MKVVFLSYSDFKGGASMAAFSIFNAIEKKKFFFLTVEKKHKKSKSIYSNIHKFYIFFLRILKKILILLFCKGKFHQSLNIFNAFIYKKIEKYNPDIINLHWINRSMISLSELNKLKSKIVISFHDMWYFNPTEHYFEKNFDKNSYLKNYCWKLKRKILYKKMYSLSFIINGCFKN